MKCPICNGSGIMVSEKVRPQGAPTERECVGCGGTGIVEVEQGSKQIITIIKPHGVYMSDVV